MITLQDRMNNMRPYFRGLDMYNEAIMVKVAFPNKWKAYPSDDGRINVTPSENDPNMTYYYADSNNTTYEDIFDLIEQTIKANQDILLKLQLLRDKGEELKELFSKLSYEELKTLKFVTESIKEEKPKRKYTRKKKVAENVQEPPQIENNEDMEELLKDGSKKT